MFVVDGVVGGGGVGVVGGGADWDDDSVLRCCSFLASMGLLRRCRSVDMAVVILVSINQMDLWTGA